MSLARRFPVLTLGLLVATVGLCGATVTASTDAANGAAPPHGRAASSALPATRRAKGAKSTSASLRRQCFAARRHHTTAGKTCLVKKRGQGTTTPPASSPPIPPAPSAPPTSGSSGPGEVHLTEPPASIEPVAPTAPPSPGESESPVPTPTPVEPPTKGETKPFRFFAASSFWNAPLATGAPLDLSSSSVVAALSSTESAEFGAKVGAAINTTAWSVPIYTVPANQATVRVKLVNNTSAALQSAWGAVPLPSDAQPAAGSDEHLVVWQPSMSRMWEFWGLEKVGGAWQASWGGAMEKVSANKGVYGPEAWLGAANSWGASASSLPIAGGLITLEDLQMGQINHALAIAVPSVRAGVYASPAQRTDGSSAEPSSLPEGARLRLDPALNLAALHLPRLTLMIAEAAQRYGLVVRDRASNIAFYAQDPIPTGTEPYGGTHGYFEGQSSLKLLASFPWGHLQLLKMELHSTT
jgi:hypothetical protein